MSRFSLVIELPSKSDAELAYDAFQILLEGVVVPLEEAIERACANPEALASMGGEDFFPPDERYGTEPPEAYDLAAELLRNMLAMPAGRDQVAEFTQQGVSLLGFNVLATDVGDGLEFCHDGDSGLPDAAAHAASALLKAYGGEPVGFTSVDPHDLWATSYVCTAERILSLNTDDWVSSKVNQARATMTPRPEKGAGRKASRGPGGP